jgi:hypothetical protein
MAVGFPPVTLTPKNRPSTTKYYCLVITEVRLWAMLALSGLCEGFAGIGLSTHRAAPVLKNLAVKPCVSITSKLIETTRLQVPYFSHLRKKGRGGVTAWYTGLVPGFPPKEVRMAKAQVWIRVPTRPIVPRTLGPIFPSALVVLALRPNRVAATREGPEQLPSGGATWR